jgi:hypothetical protein
MKNRTAASDTTDDLRGSGEMATSVKRRRIGTKFVTLLGVAAAVVAFSATPASAWDRTDTLRNWGSGQCLDSNGQGEVYAQACALGNSYQRWTLISAGTVNGHDAVQIRNVATGLYLSSAFTAVAATPIPDVWAGDGPNWQSVSLINRDGRCLDSSTIKVYMNGCNIGGYQDWKHGY